MVSDHAPDALDELSTDALDLYIERLIDDTQTARRTLGGLEFELAQAQRVRRRRMTRQIAEAPTNGCHPLPLA